jgi:hypothetical protein
MKVHILNTRRRGQSSLDGDCPGFYGVLRRNGRLLYVSDLVEWREIACELSQQGPAAPLVTDREIRRVHQRLIREHVAGIAAFYRFSR